MKRKAIGLLLVCLLMMSSVQVCSASSPDEMFSSYYEEGQYKVGKDIPEGEYVLLTTNMMGYFSVSSDANGNDIICNDNFQTNSIITVENGEYIDIKRAIAVPSAVFYESYVIKKENYGTMLKVGYDIEPGEYRIIAESGKMGYYCIYETSKQDELISNDNFKNSVYVSVTYGQYLVLNRCRIDE